MEEVSRSGVIAQRWGGWRCLRIRWRWQGGRARLGAVMRLQLIVCPIFCLSIVAHVIAAVCACVCVCYCVCVLLCVCVCERVCVIVCVCASATDRLPCFVYQQWHTG